MEMTEFEQRRKSNLEREAAIQPAEPVAKGDSSRWKDKFLRKGTALAVPYRFGATPRL
jgi:hypothetical protein